MFKLYKRKKINNIKKNKIVLTLFLLLFIGIFRTRYSYSYYKYMLSSKNNLKIKIGNISVNFDKRFKENINVKGLNPGESKEGLINIKNNGTLKAKVKLKFFKKENYLDKEFLSNFEYKILVKNEYQKSKEFKGCLYDLLMSKEFINVKDEDGKSLILNPNEDIKMHFTLYLNKNIHYKYYNKTFDFSLDIISSQINNSI